MDRTIKNLISFMKEALEKVAEEHAAEVAKCYDCNKSDEERKLFEILRSYFEEEQGFMPNFTKPYGRENARIITVLYKRWKNRNRNKSHMTICEEEERTAAAFPKIAASIGSQLLARHRRWDTRELRTLLFRAGEL